MIPELSPSAAAARTPLEAPAVGVKRCNPFGHGTDRGPKHLMGGLYGPEYEGRIKWECKLPSIGRYYLQCRCDHKGQEMDLCADHVYMIPKRMAGACPPCAMPPQARGLFEDIKRAQGRYSTLYMQGGDPGSGVMQGLAARANDLSEAMNDLVRRGVCHRCQLYLHERS